MDVGIDQKYKFLNSLSEDEFREKVVRRLYRRVGYSDGRDLDGPEELGKDAVFYEIDSFGEKRHMFLQTKIGNINMAAKASTNIANIVAQLRTALETPFKCISTKSDIYAKEVIFCTSGRMNEKAREYVLGQVRDARLRFQDRDDLIPLIDKHCPEIWIGIETDLYPYLRALSNTFGNVGNLNKSKKGNLVAALDFDQQIDLHLMKRTVNPRRRVGQIKDVIETRDFTSTSFIEHLPSRALITGDAGSGKTELVKRVAYSLARMSVGKSRNAKIPLVAEACELVGDSNKTLETLMNDIAKDICESDNDVFSSEDLDEGRLVFLIDAVDEIGSSQDIDLLMKSIADFMKKFPNNSVIVSSRQIQHVLRSLRALNFEQYEIMPLEFKQAERILKKIQKKETIPASETQETLRRINSIHGIELNPLLVSIFIATNKLVRSDVPANITELFKKYTELMLGRWDESKGVEQQYQAPLKDKLLCGFAFMLHRQNRVEFRRPEMEAFFLDALEQIGQEADASILLEETLIRSELFKEERGKFKFRHHMLQEFFAGRGVTGAAELVPLVKEEWWQNAVVFHFGERPQSAKRIVDTLLESNGHATWQSIVTIGLAIQTCYMSDIADRVEVWKYCVESLFPIFADRFKELEEARYPTVDFMMDYLLTRDAVALSVLNKSIENINEWQQEASSDSAEMESRQFWACVGLLESGNVREALERVRGGSISDQRYLLALHFGARLASGVRYLEASERKNAECLADEIEPKIRDLIQKAIQEFRGNLLEIRKGEVKAIDGEVTGSE
ncbi:NACHT domain-containing protein [Wenzhouxiangella sp. EGI_FJ10305]|uniref:NACHT domain-containing protein n=1 Tax=Wenzhouxiangella sp. EGI_FJ10305 TaxID=3243768 RepID=UPI0035DB6A35